MRRQTYQTGVQKNKKAADFGKIFGRQGLRSVAFDVVILGYCNEIRNTVNVKPYDTGEYSDEKENNPPEARERGQAREGTP